MARARFLLIAGLLVGPVLGGCSRDGTPTPMALPTTESLPKLPSLPAAQFSSIPLPVGTPTEVYTRVARGLLTCWFGGNGALKPSYIYHADASPPSKGGGAEIDIHSREKTMSDPRALKAWSVSIKPGDGRTDIDIQNFKFHPEMAAKLEGDVRRWAGNQEGCAEAEPVSAGWGAGTVVPVADTKKAPPDAKKKGP
jgi:hypothetical protein